MLSRSRIRLTRAVVKKQMDNQSDWKAKMALACYFALVGGTLIGSLMVELILSGMGIDYLDLPFPFALVATPVNESIILGVTLLFAKYNGASFKELGLKKASFRILLIVSVLAVFLFLIGLGISIVEEIVFGPDPIGKLVAKSVMPRNSFQLITIIALSIVLVGPCEELAYRGFIQKGFENSFGKMKGFIIASAAFGLLHGLNTPYAIIPAFAGGLILGVIWQKTGRNTSVSALMHGMNNSISFVIAYLLAV